MNTFKRLFDIFAVLALTLTCGLVMSLTFLDTANMAVHIQERIASFQGKAGFALILTLVATVFVRLLAIKIRFAPFNLVSEVPEHAGSCVPIWINTNQVHYAMAGAATGFFRRARRLPSVPFAWLFGPEFHGFVCENKVHDTHGKNGRLA